MASRDFREIKGLGTELVEISGSFRPKGTGTPVVVEGKGFTVARTSLGLYTLTFADKYAGLVSLQASVRRVDATPWHAVPGAYNASARTLPIRTLASTAGGDATTALAVVKELPLASAREIQSNAIGAAATGTNIGSGGLLASDTFPALQRVNGATDKAERIAWAATKVNEIAFAGVIPSNFDNTQNLIIHLLVGKDTNTNTAATLGVSFFQGVGDSDAGGNTSALDSASVTEHTVTILAANLPDAAPGFFSIGITPSAHADDAIYLYGIWVEWQPASSVATTGETFGLADMADNAANVVDFTAKFRNSQVA